MGDENSPFSESSRESSKVVSYVYIYRVSKVSFELLIENENMLTL